MLAAFGVMLDTATGKAASLFGKPRCEFRLPIGHCLFI